MAPALRVGPVSPFSLGLSGSRGPTVAHGRSNRIKELLSRGSLQQRFFANPLHISDSDDSLPRRFGLNSLRRSLGPISPLRFSAIEPILGRIDI